MNKNKLKIESDPQLVLTNSSLTTYKHSLCNWHSTSKVTYVIPHSDEYVPIAALSGLVILGANSGISVNGHIIVTNKSCYSYIFLAKSYQGLSGSGICLVKIL